MLRPRERAPKHAGACTSAPARQRAGARARARVRCAMSSSWICPPGPAQLYPTVGNIYIYIYIYLYVCWFETVGPPLIHPSHQV